jgi:hypothetical protein
MDGGSALVRHQGGHIIEAAISYGGADAIVQEEVR